MHRPSPPDRGLGRGRRSGGVAPPVLSLLRGSSAGSILTSVPTAACRRQDPVRPGIMGPCPFPGNQQPRHRSSVMTCRHPALQARSSAVLRAGGPRARPAPDAPRGGRGRGLAGGHWRARSRPRQAPFWAHLMHMRTPRRPPPWGPARRGSTRHLLRRPGVSMPTSRSSPLLLTAVDLDPAGAPCRARATGSGRDIEGHRRDTPACPTRHRRRASCIPGPRPATPLTGGADALHVGRHVGPGAAAPSAAVLALRRNPWTSASARLGVRSRGVVVAF